MGIISYIAQVEAMVGADLYASRRIIAGKPTGIGNETKPYTHRKTKKKIFGERKLSKQQRKKNYEAIHNNRADRQVD